AALRAGQADHRLALRVDVAPVLGGTAIPFKMRLGVDRMLHSVEAETVRTAADSLGLDFGETTELATVRLCIAKLGEISEEVARRQLRSAALEAAHSTCSLDLMALHAEARKI